MKTAVALALCLVGADARKPSRETARSRIEKLLGTRGGKKTTSAGRRLGSPKQLVDTAHPLLKARWEATGKLTLADIEAAAAAPEWRTERAVRGRDRVSRLGSINDDRTADVCAAYTGSGAACFEGDLSELDDDFIVSLAPGACATCGYGEDAPSGGQDDWSDCITCANAGEEIIVLFDDCTGTCVDAAGKAFWEGLGYADLDDSACEATRACYDDDGFVDSLSLGGTNAKYAGDDGSYSYSYDDDGGDDDFSLEGCLDDCNFIKTDDDCSECWGSWDCAGFADIASSCLADCDASQANDFAFHTCVGSLTETLCYAERTAAQTCACAELNVCDLTGVGDITGYSLPGDVVDHGTTNGGWCSGGVDDCSMEDDPDEFDAAACWGLCALKYPDSLVAIDLNEGSCCCQDKCECMANIEDGNYVYTDASITTLPADCGGDDDDDYFGPIPATCADAADSEFIRECRGGPVWQQDCVDEWHAYVECRWGYIPAIVDGTYTSGPSCSLSCADALSSSAPAPAPAPRPANATALGSDAAAARGPLLATAVLGAAAAAL